MTLLLLKVPHYCHPTLSSNVLICKVLKGLFTWCDVRLHFLSHGMGCVDVMILFMWCDCVVHLSVRCRT